MEISVTLFGGLRQYLPAGSSFNKCKIQLDHGANLQALLHKIPVPGHKPYMVLLNDEKIAQAQFDDITVQPNDSVVLLPPIKGG